jgi:hypothetical protein
MNRATQQHRINQYVVEDAARTLGRLSGVVPGVLGQ